jgi:hypothetical protein
MALDVVSSLSENVQIVDDHFYVGEVPGKDLRIVMERVNKENIELWRNYAQTQNWDRAVSIVSARCDENGEKLQKGSLSDGSGHFLEILKTVPYDVVELWVCYITRLPNPEKIPRNMANYNSENAINGDHPFAKDIEMFVSVSSSPEALITSHMGVASSLEGVGNRSKGTSVDLHSFAARVMLIRNPDRKYMVNAPVNAMEMIFAKALPGSFHAGTVEMRQKMEKRQKVTLQEFTEVKIPKRSKKAQERAVKDPFDPFVCKVECLETLTVEEQYRRYKNPYPFASAKNKEEEDKEFLKFMEKHPPILSVENDKMIIYNPQSPSEPDLTIEKSDKKYEWMNVRALKPSGSTHYVAVDLLELANSKTLNPAPQCKPQV